MKERPILFSTPMVQAVLDDSKTMTRRVIKDQESVEPRLDDPGKGNWVHRNTLHPCDYACTNEPFELCPYGKVGDRLWVRESGWQPKDPTPRDIREGADTWPKYIYTADGISDIEKEQFKNWGWKSKPSIFMPRWASRINLEITGVRVERLQEITEEDAKAEGVPIDDSPCDHVRFSCADVRCLGPGYKASFCELWQHLNAKRGFGWDVNPWVWVI